MTDKKEISQLKKFLREPRVRNLKSQFYIPYHRAVLWICYGVFGDGRPSAAMLEEALEEWVRRDELEFEPEQDPGEQYELASRQLLCAVRSDQIHLIAKYKIPAEGELFPRSYVPPSKPYQIIGPSELADAELEEAGDGTYSLGAHTIELLLVPLNELHHAFGHVVTNLVKTARPLVSSSGQGGGKMGRPPVWDWEWMYVEIILLAQTPDGLPSSQTELALWVENRFRAKHRAAPDESHINKKIRLIYQALRASDR